MYLSFGDSNQYFYSRVEYENLEFSCQAHGGAVCPEDFYKDRYKETFPKNGFFKTSSYNKLYIIDDNYNKIPEFPAESYIDVTVTFTPKKITNEAAHGDRCQNSSITTEIALESVFIHNPSGVSDPN